MATEEFKIKTEVELDTSKAESKLKSFANGNDKKVSVDVDLKIKNIGKLLNKDLNNIGKKINQNLQINEATIKDFNKLDNILKNVKSTINSIENGLGDSKINIFNMDGLDPKLFDKSISSIENYVKKVENAYKRIDELGKKNKNPEQEKIEPKIDISKAENQLNKLGNSLEVLKYKFNKLDVNIVGSENISKIENQIDSIMNKARKNISEGLQVKTPEIDLDLKKLREQESLLRKLQTQYQNFQTHKINLGDNIDVSSLNKIDDVFKNAFHQISSMKDLKLDFNFDGLLNSLKGVDREVKQTENNFKGIKRIASDFKSEIASYTIGEALGEVTVDFAREIGQSFIELDRSMREIKKVANPVDVDTVGKLNEIRKRAIGIARDVGMSSADVQRSIASSLQAGMGGMKASIEVAKQSMILANVGDMTQESASKAVNTVVKSFKLSPLKAYNLEVDGTIRKTTELKNAMDMMNFAG